MKRIWNKKGIRIALAILMTIIVALGSTSTVSASSKTADSAKTSTSVKKDETTSKVEIHFIDVGQGDATLIKSGSSSMLIDAGDSDSGTKVQLYLKKQGIKKLDYLVLTHPDADHIGGADVIITKFDIGNVFMSDFKKTNKTYEELISALEYKNYKWTTPEVGSTYKIGSTSFTILAPNDTYSVPNNSSIALLLQNGENKFLFTGDAETEAESDIVKNGISIDADVYQVGHHGSNTASSKALLKSVTPEYAVISCAEGNKYGHPRAETLNNLRAMGVKVFRTDEQGSIIANSDGKKITWNCDPSDTWQAGESTKTTAKDTKSSTKDTSKSQATTASTPAPAPVAPVAPAVEAPAPAPAPVVVAPAPATVGVEVHITNTGKKYHMAGCRYLSDSDIVTTLEQAKALGLTPCSVCNPPQ